MSRFFSQHRTLTVLRPFPQLDWAREQTCPDASSIAFRVHPQSPHRLREATLRRRRFGIEVCDQKSFRYDPRSTGPLLPVGPSAYFDWISSLGSIQAHRTWPASSQWLRSVSTGGKRVYPESSCWAEEHRWHRKEGPRWPLDQPPSSPQRRRNMQLRRLGNCSRLRRPVKGSRDRR